MCVHNGHQVSLRHHSPRTAPGGLPAALLLPRVPETECGRSHLGIAWSPWPESVLSPRLSPRQASLGWRLTLPQSQEAPPSPDSGTGSWVLGFIGGLLSLLKRGFQELKPARVLGNGTHPGLPPGTGSASQTTSYIQAAHAFNDHKEPTALPSTTRNAGHLVWAQVVTRGCCSGQKAIALPSTFPKAQFLIWA